LDIIPGTLAQAEAVAREFTSVQAGFALLAIQGVDSGSANAYNVATSGGKDGSYSDGLIVEFKAVNANTGASTISVDGGATVGLTGPSGVSLSAGAIPANTWIRALYNSTYSAFTLIAPISLVTTSNTISNAAPTHLVGLTPAGGSSTACAPIDVTFALDQSISPTWTGSHTFAGMVTFLSTVAFSGGLSLTGGSSQYAAIASGGTLGILAGALMAVGAAAQCCNGRRDLPCPRVYRTRKSARPDWLCKTAGPKIQRAERSANGLDSIRSR
jgi:hypothetical protein